MSTQSWMLELHRASWRLVTCDGEAPPIEGTFVEGSIVEQAQIIHSALTESGYTNEALIVTLASNWCLTATLLIERPQELRDRQTMLYRFEECIPWSMEEFVADYLPGGKQQALLVALRSQPLAEFFRELAAQGILVQSIVPLALLAFEEHVNSIQGLGPHVLALEQEGWLDIISISDDCPRTWLTFPANTDSMRFELARLATEQGKPTSAVGYGLHDNTITEIDAVAHGVHWIQRNSQNASELARLSARRLVEGSRHAPIELKRDAFGRSRGHSALRRYQWLLQMAVGILFLAIAGSLVLRGYQARVASEKLALQQSETFRRVFPNTRVPVGIKGRLDSELAKLKGLQGENVAPPNSVSTMRMLCELIRALPTDRRFILNEIRIEDGRLYLEGEVREHGDAEWIAQQLRSQGLDVSSPRTQRLDDQRVSLRITATRPVTTKVAAKGVR